MKLQICYSLLISLICASDLEGFQRHNEWSHCLHAPYTIGGMNHNWNVDASLVNHDHFVQLTPELPYRTGSIFSKRVSL